MMQLNSNLQATFNYKGAAFAKDPEPPPNPVPTLLEKYSKELGSNAETKDGTTVKLTAAQQLEQQKLVIESIRADPAKAAEVRAATDAYTAELRRADRAVRMQLHDGREVLGAGLATTGFQLEAHTSAVHDWDDDQQVRNSYYEEITELVKRLTGATHTVCNAHIVRRAGSENALQPMPFPSVHNDFTGNYGEELVRSFINDVPTTLDFGFIEQLRAKGVTADDLKGSQMVIVNAWRSIGHSPLRNFPLAVCDNRTVRQTDLIPCKLPLTGGKLEITYSLHNASHKWYWFPNMTKEEVLLFKTFDSERPHECTLHSAFELLDGHGDATMRASCEVRLLCLFPKAAANEPNAVPTIAPPRSRL
jgi:hypothetical protein